MTIKKIKKLKKKLASNKQNIILLNNSLQCLKEKNIFKVENILNIKQNPNTIKIKITKYMFKYIDVLKNFLFKTIKFPIYIILLDSIKLNSNTIFLKFYNFRIKLIFFRKLFNLSDISKYILLLKLILFKFKFLLRFVKI